MDVSVTNCPVAEEDFKMATEETLGATELDKACAEDWTEIPVAEEDCGGTIATAEDC